MKMAEVVSPPGPPSVRSWRRLVFPGLAGLALLCFLLDIGLGSVAIPIKDVARIVFTQTADNDAWLYIVQNIRLPKAVTAVIVGCGLSVSGLQMQALFRNPLAGPSELGITAGAGLGVAVVMLGSGGNASLYAIRQLGIGDSWLLVAMASAGSALVLALVLAIAGRLRDNVVLLIVGVMVGTVTLAIISIWQYFSQPEQLQEYLLWTFGSLGGVVQTHLYVLAGVVAGGLLLAFTLSKSLNVLLLGDNYARSMGLNVPRSRLLILLSTSVLTGSITAFCGPIGFIGIAVPHLTRSLLDTADHRLLMPATCLVGTIVLLVCDSIAQLPGTQAILPINIVTSLLGGPVVIWIIMRRNTIRTAF